MGMHLCRQGRDYTHTRLHEKGMSSSARCPEGLHPIHQFVFGQANNALVPAEHVHVPAALQYADNHESNTVGQLSSGCVTRQTCVSSYATVLQGSYWVRVLSLFAYKMQFPTWSLPLAVPAS